MSTSNAIASKIPSVKDDASISIIKSRHSVLAEKYRNAPEKAWITDVATTGQGKIKAKDPLHTDVKAAGFNIPIGLHSAVGGDGDAPVPGEILCAALASCMDSTIRVIANRLSITLTHLQVFVSAEVDVRGTLKFKHNIPVGFQKMHLSVELDTEAGTKAEMVKALLNAVEASCVVMQTLRSSPEITTLYNTNTKSH